MIPTAPTQMTIMSIRYNLYNSPTCNKAVIRKALSAPFSEEDTFHDPVTSDSSDVWVRTVSYSPSENVPRGSYTLSVLFPSPENKNTLIIFNNSMEKTDDLSYSNCAELSSWNCEVLDDFGGWMEREIALFAKYLNL